MTYYDTLTYLTTELPKISSNPGVIGYDQTRHSLHQLCQKLHLQPIPKWSIYLCKEFREVRSEKCSTLVLESASGYKKRHCKEWIAKLIFWLLVISWVLIYRVQKKLQYKFIYFHIKRSFLRLLWQPKPTSNPTSTQHNPTWTQVAVTW